MMTNDEGQVVIIVKPMLCEGVKWLTLNGVLGASMT